MNRLAMMALLAGGMAAGVAGCAPTPPPVLSVDPRVQVRADAGVVAMQSPILSFSRGLMDLTVPLQNPTAHDVAVQCVVDWFDPAGRPIGGLSSAPLRIGIGAQAAEACRSVAPSSSARSFRVAITPVF